MSLKFLFALLSIAIVLSSGCKDDDGMPPSDQETIDNIARNMTVLQGASAVYNDTLLATNDSIIALDAMGQWIIDQPEVDKAYYIGLNVINVYFTNGLRSSISIIPTETNGKHKIRGGGIGTLKRFGITGTTAIKNEKVLVLIPYLNQFYGSAWGNEYLFDNSADGAPKRNDVTVLTETNVKLSDLGRMDSAGLIILNTHGVPQGFLLKLVSVVPPTPNTFTWTKEQTLELVTNQNNIPVALLANGELEIATNIIKGGNSAPVAVEYGLVVTDQYIRNINVDLTDAVVFGNHCFSGWTLNGPNLRNVPEAWKSLGAASYYGYAFASGSSVEVENSFCLQMERSLINRLVGDGDSTGVAYLDAGGNLQSYIINYKLDPVEITRAKRLTPLKPVEYLEISEPILFSLFFSESHAYKNCPDTLLDTRSQKVYQLTCIGEQVWMAENLNYDEDDPTFICPPSTCPYGVPYALIDVRNSGCPQGWHLPTLAEWQELIDAVGGNAVAGDSLKAATGWGSTLPNKYGFDAKPGGTWAEINQTVTQSGEGDFIDFWTNTMVTGSNDTAYRVRINKNSSAIDISTADTGTDFLYCRCVQD